MQPKHEGNNGPALVPAQPQLLTKPQLARLLGVTSRTIDNWMRYRKIPAIRITKRCHRFIAADVMTALRRLETEVAQ
jgi:excisionase family DNA binding protein